ncbi:MAG: hypothetical protein JJU08_19270 [Rhodobacteraceae bacterium]|nr:hypothetical protein [Paracoccaceae bacterium]
MTIYPTLEQAMDVLIGSRTVSFVECLQQELRSCGSGTLVTFGSVSGILTAGHVWHHIATNESIGLCLFPPRQKQYQGLSLDMSECRGNVHSNYAPNNDEECGPDLAFIPLYGEKLSEIEAKVGSFYRLRGSCDYLHEGSAQNILSGSIAEQDLPVERSERRCTININGRMSVGEIATVRACHDLSRVKFQESIDPDFPPVATWGGMSGGGLWKFRAQQLKSGKGAGKFEVDTLRLIGVAYWQSPSDGVGVRHIHCHNERDIVDFLNVSTSETQF